MAVCTFCKQNFTLKGKMYVQKTGKILRFCSLKCEKNMIKLGREPRYVKWVSKKRK